MIAAMFCFLTVAEPPPEVVRTAGDNGGHLIERHRVPIHGAAVRHDGSPAAGQAVLLLTLTNYAGGAGVAATTTTDGEGAFAFEDAGLLVHTNTRSKSEVSAATFQLFAHGDAGWAWTPELEYRPGGENADDVDVFGPGDTVEPVLTFTKPVRLSGTVTDDSGEPLAAARIRFGVIPHEGSVMSYFIAEGSRPSVLSLPGDILRRETDAKGRYEFAALPSGTTSWAHADPGGEFTASRRGVRLTGTDETIDFRFDRARDFTVRVTDADGGPVAGATVFASSPDRNEPPTETGADGVAVFRTPPTTFVFSVRPPVGALLMPRETEEIPTAGLEGVDVTLPAAAGVEVRVVDRRGDPVPGVRVGYAGTEPPRPLHSTPFHVDNPVTNSEGLLRAVLPPEGGTRLVVIKEGGRRDPAATNSEPSGFVPLVAGESAEVTLAAEVEPPPEPGPSRIGELLPDNLWRRDCAHTKAVRRFEGVVVMRALDVFEDVPAEAAIAALDTLPPLKKPDVERLLLSIAGVNTRTGEPHRPATMSVVHSPVQSLVQWNERASAEVHLSGPEWSAMTYNRGRQMNVMRRADDNNWSVSAYDVLRPGWLCRGGRRELPGSMSIEADNVGGLRRVTASSDEGVLEMDFDPATAVLLRYVAKTPDSTLPRHVRYQFAPVQHGDVVVPTVCIELRRTGDEWRLEYREVVAFEAFDGPRPDAFAVAADDGVVLVDQRFDGDGRPDRSTATRLGKDVPDILRHVMAEPPRLEPARPNLVYGRPAPELRFDAGLGGPMPDVGGRLTLLHFTSPRDTNDHLLEKPAALARAVGDRIRVVAVYPHSEAGGEDRAAAERHFAGKRLPYAAVVDAEPAEGGRRGATADAFEARYPDAAVIAADGTLIYYGHLGGAVRAVERQLSRERQP